VIAVKYSQTGAYIAISYNGDYSNIVEERDEADKKNFVQQMILGNEEKKQEVDPKKGMYDHIMHYK